VTLCRLCAVGALSCGLQLACAASKPQQQDPSVQRTETVNELLRRAEASAYAGDMTRAEQYFVAARELGADEKKVVQRLLVVSVADRRYPVALDYAEDYLRRHPSDMEVAFAAASIYAAVGEPAQARALLEKVVHAHPDWADAHYVLASVLRQTGEELALADRHDLLYLRLAPNGPLSEVARSRLRRSEQ
jgi:tetratricopeptide (TPR) repeat protein